VGSCSTKRKFPGLISSEGIPIKSSDSITGIRSTVDQHDYCSGKVKLYLFLSYIDYYIFKPESDRAQVFGSCIPNPFLTMPISTDMYVGGFWLAYLYVSFPPGIYTVAAGDEWGNMALVHFAVTF
jgi:hypothetical protein